MVIAAEALAGLAVVGPAILDSAEAPFVEPDGTLRGQASPNDTVMALYERRKSQGR